MRRAELAGILGTALLLAGCGRFTPPEEARRGQDLIPLARTAVQALRDRDYALLYPLCSTAYRRGRTFEEFLAKNRAAESRFQLAPCKLDQPGSRIEESLAMLVFHTELIDPDPARPTRLPRRLLVTLIREASGWKLHDVLTFPATGPLPLGGSGTNPPGRGPAS